MLYIDASGLGSRKGDLINEIKKEWSEGEEGESKRRSGVERGFRPHEERGKSWLSRLEGGLYEGREGC